jgi:Uma2 family endonuclease
MATVATLLTAEEYLLLPDDGRHTELVRGKIVAMNMPAPRHGYYCSNIVLLVGSYVKDRDLGRVLSNHSGVVTEHDPDTVRGSDVCFYSYSRVPKGPLPEGYLEIAPELVFEVRSPSDRRSAILLKVGEYLTAGVQAVCVLDPQTRTLTIYRDDKEEQRLSAEDEFTLPDILGEFGVLVRRFFE